MESAIDIEAVLHENLLNRQFDQKIVDAIWVTDITHITSAAMEGYA